MRCSSRATCWRSTSSSPMCSVEHTSPSRAARPTNTGRSSTSPTCSPTSSNGPTRRSTAPSSSRPSRRASAMREMHVAEHHLADVDRQELEEVAAEAPGVLVRGVEGAAVVFIGLVVCPPLAILAVVVLVPLLAIAIVVGLLVAIVAGPYLLVRHVREHHRTQRSSALAHHLRRLRAREA